VIVPPYRVSIDKFSEYMLRYTAESVVRVAVLEIDIHATCGSIIANLPDCRRSNIYPINHLPLL
jgi:hypothetical protein